MSHSHSQENRSMPQCEIVGIGVSVWDGVLLVDSLPEPGSVVQAKRRLEGIGGGITIAMATAARLGSRTAMIDSLGNDDASVRILDSLRREGVQTQHIVSHEGRSSSVASIWSETKSAERTIVFSPGTACDLLEWSAGIHGIVSNAKVLHLNGRHPHVCMQAISVAKEHGVKVSFDGGAYRYRDEILPMLTEADIAIVARQFAESHFRKQTQTQGTIDCGDLAEFLMADLNCEVVGVTDGPRGSFLIERGGARLHQPAFAIDQAIDTTGCGDTYHGAFLHALIGGRGVKESAAFAAAISSANSQQMGALAFSLPAHDHI